ncbi:hypothetical protein AMATHDRAFT_73706 [Amanita thiersii Skay4041]|uniref:Uncharacterized protein n=1 Tax=Amanita thiersii Skay4041 TaxID=703135 RepID=A0A2A9NSS5_9AGAR|nr:hypothetical protein AMATHDRAFT_73706 [Amanita thiersii Skay4041]
MQLSHHQTEYTDQLEVAGPSDSQASLTDDDLWEDIPAEDSQSTDSTKPKSRPHTPAASPYVRKRKPHKPPYIIPSTPRRGSVPPLIQKKKPLLRRNEISADEILDGTIEGAMFTGHYFLDIVKFSIHLMRKPLAVLLFLVLLAPCIGWIAFYMQKSLQPLCFLPFVSRSSLCIVREVQHIKPVQPWEKLVQVQTKTFGQLLDESVGGSGLSLEIKKAEIATNDLVTLVRHSDLKARDSLATTLKRFVDNAKKTGRGLQKMSAKVAGAVDNILAVNTYALQTIEEANSKKPSVFSSLVPWLDDKSKKAVANTFADTMVVLSANLERLILEAEVNLANLNALEEHLSTLHDMVTREGVAISGVKDELLADLWTILGGNRSKLKNLDTHISLLKNLGVYRRKALAHVTAALETLQAMSDDMEDLRERVATPELVGPSIPMEVHVKSIQNGIERLQEGRNRAKRIEADAVRRVLDIGKNEEDFMI